MSLNEDRILIVDAAFGKINDKLSTIYQNEKNRQKYARRWIWELIQNARDSKKKEVHIFVVFDEINRTVSFSHDGECFDHLSLSRLITQISGKIEEEDNTGRFGTGFITTNLISKIIYIQGTFKKRNRDYSKLDFILDRSAWKMDEKASEYANELKSQIQEAITKLNALEDSIVNTNAEKMTCFTYPINDQNSLENVKIGIRDLEKQLPLVMAFNPAIDFVEVNSEKYICRRTELVYLVPTIQLSYFEILKNGLPFKSILLFTDIQTNSQMAFYVAGKQIENYPAETPRLFCRFPMVGTESFGLPIVFNSEYFEVTETRDALIDNHPQNLKLLNVAMDLYHFSLEYFIQLGYQGYQHICKMDRSNMTPMSKPYADKIIECYSDKQIVNTFRGEMKSLKLVRIPYIRPDEYPNDMPHQDKSRIYELFYNLMTDCTNIDIPVLCDCVVWAQIYPESRISVEVLGSLIYSNPGLLNTLQQTWVIWLNHYIELLTMLNKKEYLRNSFIYVNQNLKITSLQGNFRDCIQNKGLKEIYDYLFYTENKDSIKNKLIFKELNLNYQILKDILYIEDDKTIATKIAQKVAEEQVEAKRSGKLNSAIQKAFYELFYWMNSNEALAATLFPATYNDRMSLCSPKEQIEHYNFGVQAKQELEKHGVSSVNDLVQKIESKYSKYADICLLEIQSETLEILSNKPEEIDETDIIHLLQRNSIQNEQELIWLLQASNYSAEVIQNFLQYRRSSLDKAYEIVNRMLSDAAHLIFDHLRRKPQIYDLSKVQQIAPTVYDGITKNGQDICIIARPSNNGKVILYYDCEPDYLRKNYELWIVDTNNISEIPRILTFGDMIKITGIRVIPLQNLFD